MAYKFVEIKIEDEHDILHVIERLEAREREHLRDIVDDLSDYAAWFLRASVPVKERYTLRHVDNTPAQWFPGGAGGGGEWRSVAGVKAGTSRHPIYVEFGTGIYAGRGLIWAHGVNKLTGRVRPVMTFQKRGEPRRYRYWIRGQRGQRYFYLTWRVLNAYARQRLAKARL